MTIRAQFLVAPNGNHFSIFGIRYKSIVANLVTTLASNGLGKYATVSNVDVQISGSIIYDSFDIGLTVNHVTDCDEAAATILNILNTNRQSFSDNCVPVECFYEIVTSRSCTADPFPPPPPVATPAPTPVPTVPTPGSVTPTPGAGTGFNPSSRRTGIISGRMTLLVSADNHKFQILGANLIKTSQESINSIIKSAVDKEFSTNTTVLSTYLLDSSLSMYYFAITMSYTHVSDCELAKTSVLNLINTDAVKTQFHDLCIPAECVYAEQAQCSTDAIRSNLRSVSADAPGPLEIAPEEVSPLLKKVAIAQAPVAIAQAPVAVAQAPVASAVPQTASVPPTPVSTPPTPVSTPPTPVSTPPTPVSTPPTPVQSPLTPVRSPPTPVQSPPTPVATKAKAPVTFPPPPFPSPPSPPPPTPPSPPPPSPPSPPPPSPPSPTPPSPPAPSPPSPRRQSPPTPALP